MTVEMILEAFWCMDLNREVLSVKDGEIIFGDGEVMSIDEAGKVYKKEILGVE